MRVLPLMVVSLALVLPGCGGDDGDATGNDGPLIVYPDADEDTIMDHHEMVLTLSEEETTGTDMPSPEGDGEAEGTDIEEDPAYMTEDLDADGTPNYLDIDSDQDGISDMVEAGDLDLFTLPVDTDLDGIPNFLDLDSDGNCLSDATEGEPDLDGDGLGDFTDRDNDGDGILDIYEIGPDCGILDSDGDGTPDFEDSDSDGDGIADLWEGGVTDFSDEPVDTDGDGIPDYLDLDSDGDGLLDADEGGGGELWEAPRDTDGDGIFDFVDTDSDGDGLSDEDEVNLYGTDPLSDDTDGDGFTDGAEVLTGNDPMDPTDIIDGVYVVVPERTDVDEEFEFTLSVQMGDIAIVLDTTGSMQTTLNAMASEFSTIVTDLSSTIPDAEYGVATFDDYNYGGALFGMGNGQDRPFILRDQVTSDVTAVQNTLSNIPLHGGVDWPESSGEAIYQTLAGTGYDQNCNGSYDAATDVRPFLSDPADVFGGAGGQGYNPALPGGDTLGGVGFRPYALPIVVYATDADMRYAGGPYPTPGGCTDASNADIQNAAAAIGAKLIGICVNNAANSFNCTARSTMETIAAQTGSYVDLDGDGVMDQPGELLVYDWSGNNANFRNTIVSAIDDLVNTVQFQEITLEIEGDDQGFVVGIDPAVYYPQGAINGDVINFTLSFRGTDAAAVDDELFQLTLNVLGDGATLLDSLDIWVLVPGVQI